MTGETPSIQPVILAGGSGIRLWPASRRDRPKQLLALTGDHSLLQQTALRLNGFTGGRIRSDPLVVTNRDHRLVVAGQLAEIGVAHPRIILEPMGRNTAPALTLACLALPDDGEDPVLLVMASDHLITENRRFQAAVADGASYAAEGSIVLFGVVPHRAETGYGYIQVGEALPDGTGARSLLGFREKPSAETAERYLSAGDYLWNSGMFMMRRSVWLQAIERFRPDIHGACRRAISGSTPNGDVVRLDNEAFTACPSDSIDCAVMEQLAAGPRADEREAFRAVIVPLDCGWSDVGGWAALCDISPADEAGNVAKGEVVLEDTRGTFVQADSRLVAVLGVDDLVVVDTPDALLVAAKERTRDLKKLVERVSEKDEALTLRHQRQYRPWGRFDSIDTGERFQVKHIVVAPGGILSLQLHHHRAEHWVVVHGVAEVTCGDTSFRLGEDESTYVPVNTPHRLFNPGTEPLEIIEVQSGDYLGEDDIVRLEDNYGRLDDR